MAESIRRMSCSDNLKRIGILIFFVLSINIPYFIAAYHTPSGFVFTGILLDSADINTYLSKMTNAQYGYQYLNNFTLGETNGGYHFLFYILLGKAALIFGIDNIVVFHISRTVLALTFGIVVFKLLDELSYHENQKLLMAFLVLFGNTIPSLESIARIFHSDLPYTATLIPEIFTSTSAMYIPHFIAVMIFQVLCVKYALAYENNRLKSNIKIGVVLLFMALIHPFMTVLTGVIIGLYMLINDLINRNTTMKHLTLLLIIAIPSLPYLIYSLYANTHYPMLLAWQRIWIDHFQSLNLIFNQILIRTSWLIVIFLILFVIKWRRMRKLSLLVLWISISVIAVLLPTHLHFRLAEGIGIPIFILLGLILGKTKRLRKLFILVFVGIFTCNTFLLSIEPLFSTSEVCYISEEKAFIYDWIELNVDYDDIIFSDFINGNFIPGMTGKRVVLGHNYESIDAEYWKEKYDYISRTGDIDALRDNEIEYYLCDKREPMKPEDSLVHIELETENYILYRIIL